MLLPVTPLRLFVLAIAGQFIFGIALALPGTLFRLPLWTSALGFDVPAQANLLGTEAIFGGWSAVYAIAVVPEAPPSVIVGLYWGGVCLARALAPLAFARLAKRDLLMFAAGVAALASQAMAAASTVLSLAAATFVVGVALGPLAPTIVSIAGDRYPRQMGTVIGLLLSAGQIGSTVLPWITGRVAVSGGFRAAMLVPAVAIATVSAGALAGRRQRR